LDSIGITVNKNMIPFDPEKPSVTSGVRIGLTAITQRGLGEDEIVEIAEIMNRIADRPQDEAVLRECRADAQRLISNFPLYPEGTFKE
jgi:glycine hydroxymethyltransferase